MFSNFIQNQLSRGVLLKSVLKIWSKFIGEHLCRNVISTYLFCNFIKITLRYECSPVNLLHIFRKFFYKNISRGLLLFIAVRLNLWHLESKENPNQQNLGVFQKISLDILILRHNAIPNLHATYVLWFNKENVISQ